jgi:hypothetical protein
MAMVIIDSQVHIWGPKRRIGLQYENASNLIDPYLWVIRNYCGKWRQRRAADGLRAADVGGIQNEESSGGSLHPDRFAVMGRVAIDKPESRELLPNGKTNQACWEYA